MAKAKTQPPKGTRDLLPSDMRRREHVTGIIREVYEAHGFEPLETPALERLDTLLGKYGDEGDQLLFKVLLRAQPLVKGIRKAAEHLQKPDALVQGRSGETAPGAEPMLADLGLRYDLTVPLARVYAAYQGKLPPIVKRYQIQPVWRADTPGRGRYREFYQCDVDVVGSESRVVEAEVAGAVSQCMQRLGFEGFHLRINHRGLLRALMEVAGVPRELEGDAIGALDKLDKVAASGVEQELEAKGVSAEARRALLSMVAEGAGLERIDEMLQGHEEGRRAVADVRQVLELGGQTAAAEHLRFDVSLARGLGYYTGCIFEINVEDLAGSLGGGGRYDGLIGMFLGRDVPACGFSLGLERILVVMEEREMFPESLTHADVVVAPTHADDLPRALHLSTRLRRAGHRVELRPRAEKPGKLRKYADNRAMPVAVWIEHDKPDHASVWTRVDARTEADQPLQRVDELVGAAVEAARALEELS